MIELKLAVRNLLRNRWRSGLTMAGVAVAVAVTSWTVAFYEGWIAEMIVGATSVGTGQIQVQSAAYAEEERVYRTLDVSPEILDAVEGVEGVSAASPRLSANGIVGNEHRSQVARILGVDPVREARVSPVSGAVDAGRWLSDEDPAPDAAREVVLGYRLATQLRVAPGDELVVFLEAADGSLGNDLLEVVGTVRTGNSELDRSAALMRLDDARRLTALGRVAHAIVAKTDEPEAAREVAEEVAATLRRVSDRPVRVASYDAEPVGAEDAWVVRPWQDLVPAMDQMILLARRSYWVLYLIIYVVAAVGIFNTQRMSAIERRREFGVMLALGMRPRRMFRILETETVVLGLAGTLLGGLAGGLLAWYHAVVGLDMSGLTSQASFTYMGVAFDERVHFVIEAPLVAQSLLVMMAVVLVSGVWPAVTAARIDPAPTIAGRAG